MKLRSDGRHFAIPAFQNRAPFDKGSTHVSFPLIPPRDHSSIKYNPLEGNIGDLSRTFRSGLIIGLQCFLQVFKRRGRPIKLWEGNEVVRRDNRFEEITPKPFIPRELWQLLAQAVMGNTQQMPVTVRVNFNTPLSSEGIEGAGSGLRPAPPCTDL